VADGESQRVQVGVRGGQDTGKGRRGSLRIQIGVQFLKDRGKGRWENRSAAS